MGPNRRRLEREEAQARAAQRRKEEERRAADVAEAAHIFEAWNDRLASGRRALFSPTIGAAAIAGYRWLTVQCPGCGTVKEIDLTTIRRHPDASLMSSRAMTTTSLLGMSAHHARTPSLTFTDRCGTG